MNTSQKLFTTLVSVLIIAVLKFFLFPASDDKQLVYHIAVSLICGGVAGFFVWSLIPTRKSGY